MDSQRCPASVQLGSICVHQMQAFRKACAGATGGGSPCEGHSSSCLGCGHVFGYNVQRCG